MSETATTNAPVKVAPNVSRELAVAHHGNASVPMPTNFDQMKEFAKLMSQGTNMVGPAFRDNPGACLGALIQSMRWGMDPYSCSQKMYIASKSGEGPIAYEAQLVHAVILTNAPLSKRPRCTYSGEGPDLRCHVVFHVIGEDEPLTYDSPPLKKIKKNSPLWVDDPEQQIWYYSVRAGARRHFPDVIMGVYTPDEVDQVAHAQAGEAKVVTLSDGAVNAASEGERPVEAEFTDGTAVLEKNTKKKPKAPKQEPPADPKPAEEAKPVEQAKVEEPQAAEGEDEVPHDEKLLSDLEATLRATPRGKMVIIKANRAWLERIREIPESDDHFARADKILTMFDLDD